MWQTVKSEVRNNRRRWHSANPSKHFFRFGAE
jgi:hypothetical protein